MSYRDFAFVYDRLMTNAAYKKRTDYLLKIFAKFNALPTLLLDVACGTGSFSTEFARRGIEVIGADMSEDMLSIAREHSYEKELDVLFLCQRAEELDLYGTVDGAICCMDSINHITDKHNLLSAFKRISLFLEPEKLFIFDVNTPYKHSKILGDNTFVYDENGVFCVWQNKFNSKKMTTDITLDFFTEDNGVYQRGGEEFSEKVYTTEELIRLLTLSGFKIEAIYGDLTFNPPKEHDERIFFVCRKI